MIKTLLISLLAAGCAGNDVEKLPDGYNGNTANPSVVTQTTDWAALADSCTYVLTENFLNKEEGTFWATPKDMNRDSDYIYWQQAHAIDVLIYQYERIRTSSPEMASRYKTYFAKWYENGAHNYNKSHWHEGKYGRFFNQWTDDMAWICLTLIHMSDVLNEAEYAETARQVYDKYIWPRATEGDKGMGLPWTDRAEDAENRNACTNTPSCLVAAKLYGIYKEGKYLTQAKTLYDYNIANMPQEGMVENPPLSYTQGTFGEACRVLYHITGEKKYLDKAAEVLMYTFNGGRCTDAATGVLRDEGTSMDQTIFKAVFVPYAVNYILDESAPQSTRNQLKDKLLLCGRHLSGNLDRDSFPQMFCGHSWVKPFSLKVPSMGAQSSGASLMEGLARIQLNSK